MPKSPVSLPTKIGGTEKASLHNLRIAKSTSGTTDDTITSVTSDTCTCFNSKCWDKNARYSSDIRPASVMHRHIPYWVVPSYNAETIFVFPTSTANNILKSFNISKKTSPEWMVRWVASPATFTNNAPLSSRPKNSPKKVSLGNLTRISVPSP